MAMMRERASGPCRVRPLRTTVEPRGMSGDDRAAAERFLRGDCVVTYLLLLTREKPSLLLGGLRGLRVGGVDLARGFRRRLRRRLLSFALLLSASRAAWAACAALSASRAFAWNSLHWSFTFLISSCATLAAAWSDAC